MTNKGPDTAKKRNTSAMRNAIAGSISLACAAVLAGCGAGNPAAPPVIQGVALHGSVHGGQQPVTGSTIQLYAVGTSGYGSAATALLNPAPTTGSNGGFNITNAYTCPANSLVYITSTGGNSGYTNNPNLAEMAALGSCQQLVANAANTYINITEVTTVASVWALAPFMTGPTNIGTTSTNITGITNAFADVNTLVNTSTGTSPGPNAPAGATVPSAEINTLADILAVCINSSGGTASNTSTSCGKLFAAATPPSGTAPTDTITTAMDIAQNPANNVQAIFNLMVPEGPFQPTLPTSPTPNDFTIAVNFTGGGNFNAPSALAADALGDIWIANSGGNTLVELGSTGTVLNTASGNGLTAPSAIAVDASSYIWVTNKGGNSVSRFTSSGSAVSGSPYSGGGLSAPTSIAFDSFGNGWIANSGTASVTKTTSSGTLTNYTPSAATGPIAVGVNPH